MSRVVLMCGPAGAGKTTVARGLESAGLVRLSFDEEAWLRGIDELPLAPEVRSQIEDHLRHQLFELVASGADVVLDFSFWSRSMRDEYRELLRPLGVTPETIYLATPRDVVLARIRSRTGLEANEARLPEGLAARYFDHFEVPTPEEGTLTVIS